MLYCAGMSGLSSGSVLGETAPAPPPRTPVFWASLTAVYGLILAGLVSAASLLEPVSSPIELLRRPEDSLDRVVSRQLDLQQAVHQAPPGLRTVAMLFYGSSDPLAEAAGWYDELTQSLDSVHARLYREVLENEARLMGRDSPRVAEDDESRPDGGPQKPDAEGGSRADGADALSPQMVAWLHAAYPATGEDDLDPEEARIIIADIRRLLPAGWFADTLVARVAQRIGDTSTRAEAESAITERGRVLLRRTIALGGGSALLVVAGIAVLAVERWRLPRVADAPVPAEWLARDGIGLFVRGAAAFLAITNLSGVFVAADTATEPVLAILAGVPLLILTVRCFRGYGTSLAASFGLRIPPRRVPALVRATVVLVGLAVIAEGAIALASEYLGVESHWADGFPEELVWAPAGVAALHLLDTVAWTPFIEEVAFRGVLYGTLRQWLSVWPSALLSSAVFASAHGYGTLGFAAVFVSAVIWAIAYERTGSLLPGILAHAVNNLLVGADVIWLLRL
jgi:uncharacterized protein